MSIMMGSLKKIATYSPQCMGVVGFLIAITFTVHGRCIDLLSLLTLSFELRQDCHNRMPRYIDYNLIYN